jgi:hypothetical protein
VYEAAIRLTVFIDPEIIMTLFFEKLYFNIIVDAKVETKPMIEEPAKLVIADRGYNTQQLSFFKKIFGEVFEVEFELHEIFLV